MSTFENSKQWWAKSNIYSAVLEKWVFGWLPYSQSQRYLFNAIPDTNHDANPTNPNCYSKGNPNPTNPTNPTNPYKFIVTLDTVVNKALTSQG